VVITTDIPGNSMVRRPDGPGGGDIRSARWRGRRSFRGTSFRGLRIVLVLTVECRVVLQTDETHLLMSHARSCIVNRLREERVKICEIFANEPIKVFTLTQQTNECTLIKYA
jgi:hypothetical protein